MPKITTTRALYGLCYRMMRRDNPMRHLLWRDHRAVYQAASQSYIGEAGGFYGWLNTTRHRRFIMRKFELAGWLK